MLIFFVVMSLINLKMHNVIKKDIRTCESRIGTPTLSQKPSGFKPILAINIKLHRNNRKKKIRKNNPEYFFGPIIFCLIFNVSTFPIMIRRINVHVVNEIQSERIIGFILRNNSWYPPKNEGEIK